MKWLTSAFAALALALTSPAAADGVEVDLELVLMVDVSRSMTERELEIQRRGYAAALQSEAVYQAVQSGLLQSVAMTYIEWAGTQEVIVDWRVLQTRDDLAAFADTLTSQFNPALRRTSISEAILFGAERINNNIYSGLRQVIDISGDGPNNQGRGVIEARDAVLAQGIVINGLPLLTREGLGQDWHLDRLDLYYENCVIGGPGSFVIPVLEWDDFAEAVRRKLVLEMVSNPAPEQLIQAQVVERDPTDCLIGEKIWQDRRRYWDLP
ncbi:DUF1194 domain-containing protein [Actibacterium sp. 188UL27-1]|uniref:DUF1194 domain-containing protein n=1 Tax=Actibacterium sp. 188UL27-1 TaxID=2786961 RepID=UPI001959D343|nr:DUF1194 domain-containing protein [Actibacterium sp. 188UL27-1]MBM7065964.1 DUF1194 domain-containing protein [Actibacterium sp. 188UL27-1]